MKFASHPELEGRHAFLSASKYHWIRYDDDKLIDTWSTQMAAQRGTELHEFAARAIQLGIPLKKTQQTLNMFVNDAIGFRMQPEQVLMATPNAFGTADAISFRKERGRERMLLRVHDLKTGINKTNVNQLEIYAAYFCMEYEIKPHEIDIELRIYQNDFIQVYEPDPSDILHIMNKTMHFSRLIDQARMEAAA